MSRQIVLSYSFCALFCDWYILMIANPRVQTNPQPANRIIFKLREVKVLSQSLSHNLGLGTKYVFLHVGWVQNLNLFSVVFLLVSTRATWDSGIKILV